LDEDDPPNEKRAEQLNDPAKVPYTLTGEENEINNCEPRLLNPAICITGAGGD